MNLIICGSRELDPTPEEIDRFLALGEEGPLVHLRWDERALTLLSGGARGADAAGERWFRLRYNRQPRVFPVSPDHWAVDRSTGKRRNVRMVREADGVLAFWDGMSPGTAHCIAYAAAVGCPVFVVLRDGSEWAHW